MHMSIDPPKPPPPLLGMEELHKSMTGALPVMFTEAVSLLGRRPPRITARHRRGIDRKTREMLESLRVHLLGLMALDPNSDHERVQYALRESLLREQFRMAGRRVPPGRDAHAHLLREMERLARPGSRTIGRDKAYSSVRKAIESLGEELAARLPIGGLTAFRDEWGRSVDAQRYFAFMQNLQALASDALSRPPRRPTPRAVRLLTCEFRDSGAFFEQRLRFIVAASRLGTPEAKPWPEWEREGLYSLLAIADKTPVLLPVSAVAERNVRNALAHGHPLVSGKDWSVSFHDRERTIPWTLSEFFQRTRALTMAAVALSQAEVVLEMLCMRHHLHSTWKRLEGPIDIGSR